MHNSYVIASVNVGVHHIVTVLGRGVIPLYVRGCRRIKTAHLIQTVIGLCNAEFAAVKVSLRNNFKRSVNRLFYSRCKPEKLCLSVKRVKLILIVVFLPRGKLTFCHKSHRDVMLIFEQLLVAGRILFRKIISVVIAAVA